MVCLTRAESSKSAHRIIILATGRWPVGAVGWRAAPLPPDSWEMAVWSGRMYGSPPATWLAPPMHTVNAMGLLGPNEHKRGLTHRRTDKEQT